MPTHDDPRGIIPAAPPPLSARQAACGEVPTRALTLPDLVDIALCRNPQTAVSWAGVRGAAAQIGIARSAQLPSASLSIGPTLSSSKSFQDTGFIDANGNVVGGSSVLTQVNSSARLAVNYLIFDGGGRRAAIDAATAQQRAAFANYADAAQGVVLNVVTAYNNLEANRAIEAANVANLTFARQSRDLATGRKAAGVATGADQLQAETAFAQAELTLIQTRGAIATSAAQLAVAIGLPPTRTLDLAPTAPLASGDVLRAGAEALIADAERLRPDIIAARANVDAAAANVRNAQSAGRPSLSVQASNGLSAIDTTIDRNVASAGLALSVPLFSGWNTRYNIAAARAQLEQQQALAEQTRQQAGLSVYSNFVALDNAFSSLATARVLVRSATLSADLAQGRYRAGVGTFADLLNAQSALASARQQLVQAEYNVRTNNAQLARAIGSIGEAIDVER
ncbi:TolC family protein [Polymorphobacter fuscus]|uniref:TolC family protein n=1 Tax=Sandarakinorhabdus fusca TaxID=1439888 RepID=UPI001431AF2F|nr:TolC family protein [Polymorphobacter fuscus]NJC09167.1 outer membrane protein TolC [Polymorphobacter fuscus]